MAIPLIYNIRHMQQRPVGTAATAIGIALVVAILVAALALANGFRAALVATGSPDNVIVLRKGADSELSSGLSRDVANIIRSQPDIARDPATGRQLASAEVYVNVNKPRLGQTGTSNVSVRGVDLEGMTLRQAPPTRVRITGGRMFQPGAPEVIVGTRIARRFANCGLGEKMRFGQREVTVVGHFSASGSGFESEIWGDNEVLMPLFRGDVFQSLSFRLQDPRRFAAVKKQLETDPRLHVDVHRESEFYAHQSELLTNLMRFAGIFISVIMAVGAIFAAMNTMFAAVGSRTREIAVLLTLGFRPGSIMLSFLAESVLLALIGGVLGCLLALPINGLTTSTTNWSSFSELAFAFRVTPAAMAAGLVFAVVMGVVGGFLPARRAAKQRLAVSLRGQ